jgi:hypothetical protein
MKRYYAATQLIAALLLLTAICVTSLQELKNYVPSLENMEQNSVHMIDLEIDFD